MPENCVIYTVQKGYESDMKKTTGEIYQKIVQILKHIFLSKKLVFEF